MDSIFGTELGLPARAVVALVLVLALIALTVWLMRRFGEGRIVSQAGGRGRQQRLAVLDSATVDARRRLVLIRRDNAEHLLLIGGPTDVVVEQNIVRAQPLPGTARAPGRSAFEEDEASLVPLEEAPATPASAPAPRAPAPAPRAPAAEPPRTMPQAPQRVDPQYADMAQRLEAALRKGAAEADAARAAPPVVPPRAPEPRAPQPPRPAQSAPAPRAPEPRIPEAPRAPEPRPTPASAPASQQSAADVFGSLEEEMASLLRPGKKENK
jgi:flagellar protein FliO/FliZ